MKNFLIFILFLKLCLEAKPEGRIRVPRIIGGFYNESLDLELSKFIVSMRLGSDDGIYGSNHICAGTIISKRIILTAAHCVVSERSGRILDKDYLTIVAGSKDRLKPSKYERQYRVKQIVRHPLLNFTTHVGDIALLKLTESIQEDGVHIQIINMTEMKPKPGETCTAFGWGKILFNGPLSDRLVFLNMTVLPIQDCMFFAHVSFGVICAGEIFFQEKTAGPGDSGGPFICDGKLAGVISFIVPIRTYLTSVWFYRDWIVANDAFSKSLHSKFSVLLLTFLYSKFVC